MCHVLELQLRLLLHFQRHQQLKWHLAPIWLNSFIFWAIKIISLRLIELSFCEFSSKTVFWFLDLPLLSERCFYLPYFGYISNYLLFRHFFFSLIFFSSENKLKSFNSIVLFFFPTGLVTILFFFSFFDDPFGYSFWANGFDLFYWKSSGEMVFN